MGVPSMVVQAAPGPFDVSLVVGEELPEAARREGLGDLMQPQHLAEHQQHHEAAVGVEGFEPGGGGGDRGRGGAGACAGDGGAN